MNPPPDLDRVRRAMRRLRPIERAVLTLSAGDGLSNGAVAERLGISAEAAERHLARALCKLDRALHG